MGEALSALLEVDHEDDGGTRMVSKAKETFGAACLPLPGELRFVFMFVCCLFMFNCCLFNFMILAFFFSLYCRRFKETYLASTFGPHGPFSRTQIFHVRQDELATTLLKLDLPVPLC